MSEFVAQLINLLASTLLILAFAMISQRRILSLIHLFTAQGATLVAATLVLGNEEGQAIFLPVPADLPLVPQDPRHVVPRRRHAGRRPPARRRRR